MFLKAGSSTFVKMLAAAASEASDGDKAFVSEFIKKVEVSYSTRSSARVKRLSLVGLLSSIKNKRKFYSFLLR
jgi:hypothetical protein